MRIKVVDLNLEGSITRIYKKIQILKLISDAMRDFWIDDNSEDQKSWLKFADIQVISDPNYPISHEQI